MRKNQIVSLLMTLPYPLMINIKKNLDSLYAEIPPECQADRRIQDAVNRENPGGIYGRSKKIWRKQGPGPYCKTAAVAK